MRCIPTRPTEVAVGPIYPYFIAAAAGLKSKSRLMNPIRRIEAIVTFKKQITAALLFWRKRKRRERERERERNGKRRRKVEWKRARDGRSAKVIHDLSASPS